MTNTEILTKAIQKAIDGGWMTGYKGNKPSFEYKETMGVIMFTRADSNIASGLVLEQVIFNHDFAKALWGEDTERVWLCPECDYSFEYTWHGESEDHCPYDGRKLKDTVRVKEYGHEWQYHLQQMVIADDPIKYLGEHLDG